MINQLPITLDIYKANPTYNAKQNDAGSRYILATITANGVAQSVPETATVSLKVEKADGTRTLTAGTVSEGKILVELTNQTLAAAGTATCELQIIESEPTSLLKTLRFFLNIEVEVYSDTVAESTDEFTALTEALAEVNDFKNTKEDKSNKVTSIDSESTDTQYPSAKLTYDQLALKEPNLPVTPLIPAEKFLNGNRSWAKPSHNKITDLNTDADYQHITTTQVSKLTNIEENAEVNILEGIQIDGVDVGITSKKSNISLATSTNDGAMSSEYAEKLDGIAENANLYVHPTTAGNKHIPAGGSVDKILKWSADGTASWEDEIAGKKYCKFVIGTSTSGYTLDDVDYLCDGTADQEEINTAITALPTDGGEIIILDGTYNITAKINLNKSNVTISGNGNSTILKRMYDSGSAEGVITLTSANYCKIKDLQIDGNKAIYTSSNNIGIRLDSSSNNTITGNTCNNNTSHGISLNSSNNTITGNTCNNNTSHGISLNSSNNTVTGNTCNNNTSNGILLYSSSNNTVTGNTCNNNTSSGIYLNSSSNNTITGNTYNNNNTYGIILSSSNNNTITGNTCTRGIGLPDDYTTGQYTIRLNGTNNNYNLIATNNCMGKAVLVGGGTGNSVYGNKWDAGNDLA